MPRPGSLNWSRKNRDSARSASNSSSNGPTRLKLFPKLKAILELKNLTQKTQMIDKLKSRKLWATIIGSLILTLGNEVGLSPDVTQWIATLITGYVIGQGIADAGQGLAAR
jgi:hypothetical protein